MKNFFGFLLYITFYLFLSVLLIFVSCGENKPFSLAPEDKDHRQSTNYSENESDENTTPEAPTELNVLYLSETTLQLTWKDRAINEQQYYFFISTNENLSSVPSTVLPADTESHRVYNLQRAQFYYIAVQAVGGMTNSALASTQAVCGLPPGKAKNFSQNLLSETSIELNWEDSPDESGYLLFTNHLATLPETPAQSLAQNTSSLTMTGLTPYSEFFIWVYTTNDIHRTLSYTSPAISGNTPLSPGGLTAQRQGKYVRLDWTDLSDNEDRFEIFYNLNDLQPATIHQVTASNAETTVVGPLQSGTLFYFWLRSANDLSASSTVTTSIITESKPATASNLRLQRPEEDQIELIWDDAANNESAYLVKKIDTDSVEVRQLAENATNIIFSNLSLYTPFTFEIVASNGVGISESLDTTTAAGMAPPAFDSFQSLDNGQGAKLLWSNSFSNHDGYLLYSNSVNSQPSLPWLTVGRDTNFIYVDQLLPEETTYFWLEAYNAIGTNSSLSDSVTANHLLRPQNLAVNYQVDLDAFLLSWDDSDGEEDYLLSWSETYEKPTEVPTGLGANVDNVSLPATLFSDMNEIYFWLESVSNSYTAESLVKGSLP